MAAATIPLLAACTSSPDSTATSADPGTIAVSSTSDRCRLSSSEAPAGHVVFDVSNDGSEVTEFYLLAADGKRIVGELENIGPGLTRQLVLSADAGKYVAACKPGMKGAGIRSAFSVTGGGAAAASSPRDAALLKRATASYRSFVRNETDRLLAGTRRFVTAYLADDEARARALYPRVREHWERIEPVAESFGDLDPRMDAREADLATGQRWTGWHLLEKDLWWPAGESRSGRLTGAERTRYAGLLLADTELLHRRVHRLSFIVDQIANGAMGLLDEVALSKVTGEEETLSHTDLYDFQANVDGARRAFQDLRPALHAKDPALEDSLVRRFADLQAALHLHRSGDGFVPYTSLSERDVRELSDLVNALSEPLSRLTASILG